MKWSVIVFGLLGFFLGFSACKKGAKVQEIDYKGSILFLPPTPSAGTRLNRTLKFKFKLYDQNKLSHVEIWLAGMQRWQKVFDNTPTDATVQGQINVRYITHGQHLLQVILKDVLGYSTEITRSYFFDRKGPKISWSGTKSSIPLKKKTKVEITAEDPSGVDQILVLFGKKIIYKGTEEPFEFQLDPRQFPAGLNKLGLIARDKLGNKTFDSVYITVQGSGEGGFCRLAGSCEQGLICVRTTRHPAGRCRKICRSNKDCKSPLTCHRLGTLKACLPIRSKILTEAYGRCSAFKPCVPQALCLQLKDRPARCYPLCIPHKTRCKEGFACQKYRGKYFCLPKKGKPRLRNIGEKCSAQLPCVSEALCLKVKKGPFRCYRKCLTDAYCPRNYRCFAIKGRKDKICVYSTYRPPKRRLAGLYQRCNSRIGCYRGLSCYISRGSQGVCLPRCSGAGSCGAGRACVSVAGGSVCLQHCDPLKKNCPANFRCSFLKYGSKMAYLCN